MATASLALGFEVQTPPCFTQKVQPHARAGISGGSPFHSSSKAILPQWHLPVMSMGISGQEGCLTCWYTPGRHGVQTLCATDGPSAAPRVRLDDLFAPLFQALPTADIR